MLVCMAQSCIINQHIPVYEHKRWYYLVWHALTHEKTYTWEIHIIVRATVKMWEIILFLKERIFCVTEKRYYIGCWVILTQHFAQPSCIYIWGKKCVQISTKNYSQMLDWADIFEKRINFSSLTIVAGGLHTYWRHIWHLRKFSCGICTHIHKNVRSTCHRGQAYIIYRVIQFVVAKVRGCTLISVCF